MSWIPVNYSQNQSMSSYCGFPQAQHGNCYMVKFVSHYLLLSKKKNIKKSSVVGNLEFNTSIILVFNLAFGQGAEALTDFAHISLIALWLLFFFFFFLLSTLLVSVPNLLRNDVTQGLGTSPGTNYQPPPPTATGRLVALTSWHPGLTSTELLQQPWQE